MGDFAVVKSLTGDELKQWRRGKNLAVSDVEVRPKAPPERVEFDKPPPMMPLDGPDTMHVLLDEWLAHMKGDRESYQRAMRWLRARVPDAVAHMDDQMLFEHLKHVAEQASRRVEARLGRPSRDLASRRYAVR